MTCKTIAVANQKGGTGKTATTLSLGIALAKLDKRVLLVDTDPQGDLTKSLGWANPDSLEVTVANHIQAVIERKLEEYQMQSVLPREGVLYLEVIPRRTIYKYDTHINYYYNEDFTGGIGIVIGNEGSGMGRLVKKNCDFLVKIPMKGKVTSLNASVSAGIIIYEVVKQRK